VLTEGSPRGGALRALSRFSWRRPGLVTFGQISAPVAAFVFVYVAAVVVLLIQGFWTTDSFTGKVVHTWNLDNYRAIADAPYPRIIFRTIGMAAAVTVTCMVLAFPYAYFMVRVAVPRLRVVLLVAPNDAEALAAGLRSIMTDAHVRARLRNASLAAAKELPTWSDTVARFAAAIEGLA